MVDEDEGVDDGSLVDDAVSLGLQHALSNLSHSHTGSLARSGCHDWDNAQLSQDMDGLSAAGGDVAGRQASVASVGSARSSTSSWAQPRKPKGRFMHGVSKVLRKLGMGGDDDKGGEGGSEVGGGASRRWSLASMPRMLRGSSRTSSHSTTAAAVAPEPRTRRASAAVMPHAASVWAGPMTAPVVLHASHRMAAAAAGAGAPPALLASAPAPPVQPPPAEGESGAGMAVGLVQGAVAARGPQGLPPRPRSRTTSSSGIAPTPAPAPTPVLAEPASGVEAVAAVPRGAEAMAAVPRGAEVVAAVPCGAEVVAVPPLLLPHVARQQQQLQQHLSGSGSIPSSAGTASPGAR